MHCRIKESLFVDKRFIYIVLCSMRSARANKTIESIRVSSSLARTTIRRSFALSHSSTSSPPTKYVHINTTNSATSCTGVQVRKRCRASTGVSRILMFKLGANTLWQVHTHRITQEDDETTTTTTTTMMMMTTMMKMKKLKIMNTQRRTRAR
jgi:hypothetical protein